MSTSGVVKKTDISQALGILAFVLAVVAMTYLVFGPTISFTESETMVKDKTGVRTIGKTVSGTTSGYAQGDRALLVVAAGVIATAFLGALFAWRRVRLPVIMVGSLFVIFSFVAMFSVGLFVLPVGLIFLAAGAFCRPGHRRIDAEFN